MEPFQILGKFDIPTGGFKAAGNGMYNQRGAEQYYLSKDQQPFSIVGLRQPFSIVGLRHWEYRKPGYSASIAADPMESVKLWHPDGGLWVILWSNIFPTEVLYNGDVVSGDDGDIILLDNSRVKHRMPPDYVNLVRTGQIPDRHFLRIMLDFNPTQVQVDQWKDELRQKQVIR